MEWIKSSYSAGNGQCLEGATLPGGGVAVRDSKDPDGPVFLLDAVAFVEFVDCAKAGLLDGFGGEAS